MLKETLTKLNYMLVEVPLQFPFKIFEIIYCALFIYLRRTLLAGLFTACEQGLLPPPPAACVFNKRQVIFVKSVYVFRSLLGL
jgi:hypothetical protein